MESLDKSAPLLDHLGPAKFREVADARRAMWTGGLGGLLVGASLTSLALAFLPPPPPADAAAELRLSAHQRAGLLRSRHAAIVLLGGAAGSYLGSLFLGTPALQKFSTIWRNGSED
jgi:hypothetical protein